MEEKIMKKGSINYLCACVKYRKHIIIQKKTQKILNVNEIDDETMQTKQNKLTNLNDICKFGTH